MKDDVMGDNARLIWFSAEAIQAAAQSILEDFGSGVNDSEEWEDFLTMLTVLGRDWNLYPVIEGWTPAAPPPA